MAKVAALKSPPARHAPAGCQAALETYLTPLELAARNPRSSSISTKTLVSLSCTSPHKGNFGGQAIYTI